MIWDIFQRYAHYMSFFRVVSSIKCQVCLKGRLAHILHNNYSDVTLVEAFGGIR